MTVQTIGGRLADTFTGVLDAGMNQEFPGSAGGTSDRFEIGYVSGTTEKKGAMKFTGLSNIVGPVTVQNVVISLYRLNNRTGGSPRLINCKRLLRDVTEASMSWSNYGPSLSWQTAGAKGALDVDPTVLATGTLPLSGSTRLSVTGAGLNSLVENVINGVTANPWLLLEVADTATLDTGAFDIASTQRSVEGNRPYMEVTYTPLTANISAPNVDCTKFDGTVTVRIYLDAPAPVGGVNGNIRTEDITALSGSHFAGIAPATPFSIPEGELGADVVIPLY